MNSEEALRNLLNESEIEVETEVVRQLVEYLRLLQRWGSRMNLTASVEWDALKELFRESLWASAYYPTLPVNHLDIGSGAGFPALLLRILRPGMRLDLVEVRTKRAVFLEIVVQRLGLLGVVVHNDRLDRFLRRDRSSSSWSIVSWKGLRLSLKEFAQMRERNAAGTQFWIFHGERLPLEKPEVSLAGLTLIRRHSFPFERRKYLSIYR